MPGSETSVHYPIAPDAVLRVATLDDVEDVSVLVKNGINDTPYAVIGIDADYLKGFITNLVSNPERSVIVLLVVEGKTVGVIGGLLNNEHPVFNRKPMAAELFWYVIPEFRGKYSQHLVDAYEEWARVVGCKYVTMVHFSNTPKLAKVYEDRGYKPLEVAYLKEL